MTRLRTPLIRSRLVRHAARSAAVMLCALLLAPSTLPGQTYRFQVTEMDVQLHVQPDASLRLQYRIVFANQPGAAAIDVVDIGLPHGGYVLGNMSARRDGTPARAIRRSEYIDVGVEIDLAGHPIGPGQTGTVEFECVMPDMVYLDTTDAERAGLQFRPTWFDPLLQVGTTRLRVAVHLLPGVTAEEVRYHDESMRYDQLARYGGGSEQHLVAVWEWPAWQLGPDNPKLGISFPRRGMQRVVRTSAVGLLVKWFRERPGLQFGSGVTLCGGLAVLFFRFSHGTGWILFVLLCGAMAIVMLSSPGLHLLLWPLLLGLIGCNEWYLRRRRSGYLPAMATVEGGGIKRGLTAPQAAVLLEMPLGQVATLVLFGLLRKGVLQLRDDDPPQVEVVEPFRSGPPARRAAAAQRGIVLHDYEHPFLDQLAVSGSIDACNLAEPLQQLITSVVERMQGFDDSDTREYYRRIVARAWTEAESIKAVAQRAQTVERNIDWMILRPDWETVFREWGRRGYRYEPDWSRPVPAPGGPPRGAPTPTTPTTSRTGLGEVASSFAGWAENFSGRLASAVEPLTLGIPTRRGVVDLSGVDRVTADVFTALAESSGGGGGGSGGCACACAGCACACACAGGGR